MPAQQETRYERPPLEHPGPALPTPTRQAQGDHYTGHQSQSAAQLTNDRMAMVTSPGRDEAAELPVLQRRPLYSATPASLGQKLLLVIDADTNSHHMVHEVLSALEEVDVKGCYSSAEALVLLKQWDHLPDVVLLDMVLPLDEVAKVCHCIRASYSRVELPIIMLSPEHPTEADTHAALQAGVNDFILKPMRQAELLARLFAHMLVPQLVASEVDRHHNYALLEAMLPPRIITRLKSTCGVIAEEHNEVTILFSDICNFTELCSERPTAFIIAMLNELFTRFDAASDKHGVYKVETIGDAYMAVCGHDADSPDHALRMMAMATDMLEAAKAVSATLGQQLQIRVGMHTGPAFSGVVGIKCPRWCFFGDTVNTASRMESLAFPMCIHYSHSTKEALDRGCAAACHSGAGTVMPGHACCGLRKVKGKKDRMMTYFAKVGEFECALVQLRAVDKEGRATVQRTEHHTEGSSLDYVPITARSPDMEAALHNVQCCEQRQPRVLETPQGTLIAAPPGSNGGSSHGAPHPALPRWHVIGPSAGQEWSDWLHSLPAADSPQGHMHYAPVVQSAGPVQSPLKELTPLVVGRLSVGGAAAAPMAPLTPAADDLMTTYMEACTGWDGDSAGADRSTGSSPAASPHAQIMAYRRCHPHREGPSSAGNAAVGADQLSGASRSRGSQQCSLQGALNHCGSYRRSMTAVASSSPAPAALNGRCSSHNSNVMMPTAWHTQKPIPCIDNAQYARGLLRRWRSTGSELAVRISPTAAGGAGDAAFDAGLRHAHGLHPIAGPVPDSPTRTRCNRRHTMPVQPSHSGHASWISGSVQDELMRVVEARLSSSHVLMQRCGSPSGSGYFHS